MHVYNYLIPNSWTTMYNYICGVSRIRRLISALPVLDFVNRVVGYSKSFLFEHVLALLLFKKKSRA